MLRTTLILSFSALAILASPKPLRLEAEAATALSKQVKILSRQDASGGSCLQLGITGGRNDKPGESPPDATFTAKVPWLGKTVIWGRILARNDASDSLYVAKGKKFQNLSLPVAETWSWLVLHRQRPDKEGLVTLRLQRREPGVLLDEVVFVPGDSLRPNAAGEFQRTEIKNPYAEPPFLPPSEHPRVFLRRQHIPALRSKLEGERGKSLRMELEKIANVKGDGTLPPPVSKERGNFNKMVATTILANAYLGLLDDDNARRQRALAMYDNYARSNVFSDRHDVTRDYGYMLMVGALVYDWSYDLLSPEWKKQFIEDALSLAGRTEIRYPPTRQSAITSHAGEAQLLRDQLAVAIAVYDEFPEWYRIGAGRIFQEFVPARNFFFPSHRHHQGDSYGPYRFQWTMFTTWIFDRMGAGPIFSEDQGKVPHSWLYQRRGDGQLLRDGDTFNHGEYWRFPLVMMLTASYYHDPYLEFEYRRQIDVIGRDVPALWRALFYDFDLAPKPLSELPLTKYFPEPLGAMIARTGWRQGVWSPAAVCEMKGAGYHFNNHHHLDAGGFQIYYRGGLATDAGSYGHYGIPYDWNWNKRSIAHNTLLLYDPETVNANKHDGGQNYPANSRREPSTLNVLLAKYRDGAVLAHAFGPDPQRPFFSHIKTDLTPAYADRAKKMERSCVFLNLGSPDHPGVLITFDRIVATSAKLRPVWLLHSVNEPRINGQRATISRDEQLFSGKLTTETLLPRDAQLTSVGGSPAEGKVFGEVFEADRPTAESGGWRVEVSPRNTTAETVFLHTLLIGNAGKEETLPVHEIETEKLLGARIGDNLVLFSKDGGQLSETLDLTISGEKSCHLVLTDLAEGFWSASRAGKPASHQAEASKAGAAICLRLPPGNYQLSPSPTRTLPEPPKTEMVPASSDETAPEIIDGKTPLPLTGAIRHTGEGKLLNLKPVLSAFGARVERQGTAWKVNTEQVEMLLRAGKKETICNGQEIHLNQQPELQDGQLWIGLEVLAAALRRPCQWDRAGAAVVVGILPPGQVFIQQAVASHAKKAGDERLAIDRNKRTYWAAKEDGAWLQLDLGLPAKIKTVGIDWLHSDKRQTKFELLHSLDGKEWKEIFSGQTDGETPGVETVEFPPCEMRYLRVVGHGNTKNHWNSIREVTVWEIP